MSKSMKIQKKRRRQNKTDYKSRITILKSDAVRIVIRKTNKYLVVQAVKNIESKDSVVFGMCSKELLNQGWDKKFAGSLKSLPAGYLSGLLMAKKLDKKAKYIIDLGMSRNIAGSRIYAVVKGLIDGGLSLNANKKVFPSEERLNGKHMGEDAQKMISKIKEKFK